MEEVLAKILEVARGGWLYRWHALVVAWIACCLGWFFVLSMPNVYESSTRVYVDTQSALKPLLEGRVVRADVMTQVRMMTRALLSRPNMEKVARDTDLDLRASTPLEREAMVDGLREKIEILGSDRENFYTISYSDRDRDMARKVVQSLLDTFVEDTLGEKRSDSNTAQQFLRQQIAEYEQRLLQSEEKLAEFKKKNVGMMPGESGDYYSRLQAALEQLEAKRSAYSLARIRRDELRRQLAGEEPVFGIVEGPSQNPTLNAADSQIAQFQSQLDSLLLKYTEKHPDVITLRETIEELKAQRSGAGTGSISNAGGGVTQGNLVYQNLRIALSDAEVEMASLGSEVAERQRSVDSLKRLVNTIPEIEAELARLNRDYSVTKDSYEDLLRRHETAKLSEDAEATSSDVKFRIIDPPVVPLEPSAPNRPLLLSLVLFAGVAGGLAFAVLWSQARPVFVHRNQLGSTLGVPVLGTVSLIRTPEKVRRLRLDNLAFSTGYGLLGALFVVTFLLARPVSQFILRLST